ncbi:hybrid sensor histidine kinase/response regulator transcription factor [Thermophagus sp. OGC60D27]|uniref:hybrid sensor histidine kinase/response regulator transcription factor n=1 Tax=Thermophagus sp. OGC60D27 TaxID=3458415 RepID=UPI0040379390
MKFRIPNILKNVGLLVGLLLLAKESVALSVRNKYFPSHVNYITNDDGLPQNTVNDILKDPFGFIWFGTGNGLARYDGYSFQIYGKDHLPSNLIKSLDVTSDGCLWVGTNKGLGCVDLITDQVSVFPLTPDTLPVGINKILVDSLENVWIGTLSNGLFQLKKEKGEYRVYHYSVVVNQIENPSVNAMTMIDKSTLLGGSSQGLFTIDIKSGLSGNCGLFSVDYPGGDMDVRSLLYNVAKDELWVGTFYGVMRFDKKNEIGQWYFPGNASNDLSHGTINDIESDQFGTIYIGTLGGLEIYDPAREGFVHFPAEGPEDFKLNNRFIRSLFSDEKGNVWVGTEKGGVNHFNLYQKPFYFINHDIKDQNSLSEGPVNSIYLDDENLWVGTAGGGLTSIDRVKKRFRHYRYQPDDSTSLSSDFVSALIKDGNGNLWVGTWGSGINKMLGDGSFQRFIPDEGTELGKDYNVFVSSIWYDEQGFLLIGTEGQMAILDLSSEKIVVLDSGPLSEITEVGCLLKDRNNYYWVGTRNGLFRFPASMIGATGEKTVRDNMVKAFYSKRDKKSSNNLAGDYVISLYEDREGNIWAGTYSDGVSCIQPMGTDDWKITNYNTNQGLCNNVVYGILEDQNGCLWMSTDHGLSRFDKEKGLFFNYFREDGLLSNQFYWSAACKSEDGYLYFGNINGLNYFNPRSFPDYPFRPKVFISGLRIFNKLLKTGEVRHHQKVLKKNICHTDLVSLSYRDNVITFEFTALDYFHPQKIKYAYKLEGVDKQWVEVESNQRFANYINLGGGTYQFKVKATNSDGEWNSPEKVITLIVRPPFWQTTWFKILLLSLIIVLSMVYSRQHTRRLRMQKRTLENMVKERTRQIQEQKDQLTIQAKELASNNNILEHRQKLIEGQKNELELKNRQILEQRDRLIDLNKKVKAINQSRLRFFTNVSHEFRTPLTLILAPLEKLLEDSSLPESVHHSLKIIEKNSRRLLMLINQLLTFRKIEAGKLEVKASKGELGLFLKEVFHAFDGLALDHKIKYMSNIDIPTGEYWYDGEKLENILYNLLSNAFKFTPSGGEISFFAQVDEEKTGKVLIINIVDSGPGVEEEKIEKIFDRFYRDSRMLQRAPGSGIGLALTKELTEALHGKIWVENGIKRGASFNVKIPCDYNSFSYDQIHEKNSVLFLSDEIRDKVKVIRDELADMNSDKKILEKSDENKLVILVVEDNRELGKVIRDSLKLNYNVVEAINGKEAYDFAKENQVDLIISDIMMPMMDGIELCQQIKNNLYTSHIPVILLSARTLIEHQLEGIKSGADDYVSKPFSMKLLEARVENLIESRKKLRALFENKTPLKNIECDSFSLLDQQFVEKANKVLEENFTNSDFCVESFARMMFVSRSLLYKKLKALAGLSPNDFITVYRLKRSLEYLSNGLPSVNEVAYKVGFNDPKYFSRVFKKFYHETPSEFIKKKKKTI